MQAEEPEDKDTLTKKKSGLNTYAKYSGIGFQMFGIIGVFTYVGYRVDGYKHMDQPLFTAFFSLVGVFIALYLVIRSVKNLNS